MKKICLRLTIVVDVTEEEYNNIILKGETQNLEEKISCGEFTYKDCGGGYIPAPWYEEEGMKEDIDIYI